jgi:hypothetical protein
MNTEHVIPDASTLGPWRKSSHSGGNGAECVEVSDAYAAKVPVRDSKNPSGPALVFEPSSFAAFIGAVRRGDLSA